MSGTPFEMYIYNTIRKNYPKCEGWIIEEQLTLPDGSRPDFVVSRKKEVEAVIDAKDKAKLSMRDIDQIDYYGQLCGARRAIIYIANDTEIPEDVEDRAISLGVRIIRTRWRAP